MKTIKYIVLASLLFVGFALSSCDDKGGMMSSITGKMGEIYVVTDHDIWDSEVGDTLRSIFSQAYPMLPQYEPMFKLMNIPYAQFSKAFQRYRNLIIVNIDAKQTEPAIRVRYDVYATPQIVVYVTGADKASLTSGLYAKRDTIVAYIEQAELNRQSENAVKYEDHLLRKAAEKKLGVQIFIPQGYQQLQTLPHTDFLWYTNRTTYVDQTIFIYSYAYTGDSTFTVNYLVNKRNEFLKENVPGLRDSSWMTTSPLIPPTLQIKNYKGQTYAEMRGLWDVENDYMGGPFISRSYLDTVNRRVVTVEGYVYAARFDKRDYMRRLEGIINTFRLTVPLDSKTVIDTIKKK